MAVQPPFFTAQPPPELPNMPEVSFTLTGYLRNFALWCRNGFADKLSATQALPGVLLRAYDTDTGVNKVFLVQVSSPGASTTGTLVVTPVALGTGKP